MEEALLKIEHLKKEYDGQTILKDVSVEVKKGEVIVIVGPSGCGKSTFLRCINGLEPIQGGTISLDGEQIDRNSVLPLSAHCACILRSCSLTK